jgi:hypothetical protein
MPAEVVVRHTSVELQDPEELAVVELDLLETQQQEQLTQVEEVAVQSVAEVVQAQAEQAVQVL